MPQIDQPMRILYLEGMPGLPSDAAKPPAFVSTQVTAAQRYFLNLKPRKGTSLTVVCGGWEKLRSDYQVERKTFPFLCIEFVAEGAGTLHLAGSTHPLRPGVAFAYAPGIPHLILTDPARPMRKYYVDFVGTEAMVLLRRSQLAKWRPMQVTAPGEILEVFHALQRDAMAESPLAPELAASHLRVLLLKLQQRAVAVSSAEPRALATYERARAWLHQHYLSCRTAEDIAAACHMTPVHLSRVFRRFAQTTPYHVLIRLKMNRAAELLLDGNLLVKEAAEHVGFASQFQFSRAFKRVYGLAPQQFIQNARLQ
jgi:AraC-like DNA-binding protein